MQSSRLGNFTVWYEQSEEFHLLKSEIFSQHTYYVEFNTFQPIIIDVGAHIGLATLYFKKNYPDSKIWAVEPFKKNFKILEKNCLENGLENVILIPAALAETAGTATLHYDVSPVGWHSTVSRFPNAWNNQQITKPIEVEAITLSSLITDVCAETLLPINLLKLDIEGSEFAVLEEARTMLHHVKYIILEYHPRPDAAYIKLEELLKAEGFRIETWQDGVEVNPLKTRKLFTLHAIKKSE